MNTQLDDYLVLDGTNQTDDEFEYFAALQRQINNGTVWKMQGSLGRAAMDAIKSGDCVCARIACNDYYGTRVPARTDLMDGSFGTVSFCAEQRGAEWAARIEAIE